MSILKIGEPQFLPENLEIFFYKIWKEVNFCTGHPVTDSDILWLWGNQKVKVNLTKRTQAFKSKYTPSLQTCQFLTTLTFLPPKLCCSLLFDGRSWSVGALYWKVVMLYRPIVKGWEYRGLTSFTMAPAGGLSLGYHYTLIHAFSCSTEYSALCSGLCAVLGREGMDVEQVTME